VDRRLAIGIAALAMASCSSTDLSDLQSGTGGSGASAGSAGADASVPDSSSGAGGSAGSGGSAAATHTPPPDPGVPTSAGTDTVLAMHAFFFGDTNWSGAADEEAWQSFGYDLDGLASTPSSENHCAPAAGAGDTVKEDGPGGLDNSFGARILPLMGSVIPQPSQSVTDEIASGAFTVLFHMDNLGPGSNQSGVQAAVLHGTQLATPPKFDGTDVWPIRYDSVLGGDRNQPKLSIASSYVAGQIWVSAPKIDLVLALTSGSMNIALPIRRAVITMEITGVGASATASKGMIAGVLETEQLTDAIEDAAGAVSPSLCGSATTAAILDQVRQASDIMLDGTNGNPATTCNAISVGFGFDARPVKLGSVAPAEQPKPDPCP
jgi:hypothetical protein